MVTVVASSHRAEVDAQLSGRDAGIVLFQPANCNTAAGVFLPLTYIKARNPQATVALFPSDHFVYPEGRLLGVVQQAVRTAEQLAGRIVLLGVVPTHLELEYGWIQPGKPLMSASGEPVWTVNSFVEKPDATQAAAAFQMGAFCNTLIIVARVTALWELGWQCVPQLMLRFEQLGQALGGAHEHYVFERIYQDMPNHDFSAEVLQRAPERLAVLELGGVLWSDWGRPERIRETLARLNREPAFPLTHLEGPVTPPNSPNRVSHRPGKSDLISPWDLNPKAI
jgi:mannose-1-phosphate guanylyltransferase